MIVLIGFIGCQKDNFEVRILKLKRRSIYNYYMNLYGEKMNVEVRGLNLE